MNILTIRGGVGGVLMGLANLVPGISGGTMLLATGIYPDFIDSVADITTLRFHRKALVVLGTVVGTAGVAILLLAGVVRGLVIDHRWVMYSLFVGLTLGGVPLVWRLARPANPAVWGGAAGGFVLMLLMAGTLGAPAGGSGSNFLILIVAGIAGASAMILPGISGGYLLLLLGQYEAILGAVDRVKIGLLGDSATGVSADLSVAIGALNVVVPVGIGVVVGVVGVSNLLRWLLKKHEKPTLGALLGLLLGAVVGLWPFQQGVLPNVQFFIPGLGQVFGALGLVASGLVVTLVIARLGGGGTEGKGDSAAAG